MACRSAARRGRPPRADNRKSLTADGDDPDDVATPFEWGDEPGAREGNHEFALPVVAGESGLAAGARRERQEPECVVDGVSAAPRLRPPRPGGRGSRSPPRARLACRDPVVFTRGSFRGVSGAGEDGVLRTPRDDAAGARPVSNRRKGPPGHLRRPNPCGNTAATRGPSRPLSPAGQTRSGAACRPRARAAARGCRGP